MKVFPVEDIVEVAGGTKLEGMLRFSDRFLAELKRRACKHGRFALTMNNELLMGVTNVRMAFSEELMQVETTQGTPEGSDA